MAAGDFSSDIQFLTQQFLANLDGTPPKGTDRARLEMIARDGSSRALALTDHTPTSADDNRTQPDRPTPPTPPTPKVTRRKAAKR